MTFCTHCESSLQLFLFFFKFSIHQKLQYSVNTINTIFNTINTNLYLLTYLEDCSYWEKIIRNPSLNLGISCSVKVQKRTFPVEDKRPADFVPSSVSPRIAVKW